MHDVASPRTHSFFFFNDTATTEIYTLSLHDALPIWIFPHQEQALPVHAGGRQSRRSRSEEHTSELQSPSYLVCRLLLEKKTSHARGSFATSPASMRLVQAVSAFLS